MMSHPPTEITATGMMQVKNSMQHMNQLMAEPDLDDKPGALELGTVEGRIDVEDVSFAYERDDTEVLHHVSLRVNPGETIKRAMAL